MGLFFSHWAWNNEDSSVVTEMQVFPLSSHMALLSLPVLATKSDPPARNLLGSRAGWMWPQTGPCESTSVARSLNHEQDCHMSQIQEFPL